MADGRNVLPVTLLASTARTGSGTGASVDIGVRQSVRLAVVAAVAPSADVVVAFEDSADATTWAVIGTSTLNARYASNLVTLTGVRRYLRASWTATGTNTFSAIGDATIVYASVADIRRFALPDAALAGVSATELDDLLRGASGVADVRLQGNYDLPLLAWGDGLRRAVSCICAYDFMTRRGYQPEVNARDVFFDRYNAAIDYLKIAGDAGDPEIVDSSVPADTTGTSGWAVGSDTLRGW